MSALPQTNGMNLKGFDHQTFDSTHVFRASLEALSRPGKIVDLAEYCASPESLNITSSALLLTLVDMETPVWLAPNLDTKQARDFLTFHTGCKIVDQAKDCVFAVMNAETFIDELSSLPVGTSEYPDRSATVIMLVSEITDSDALTLKGPGIEHTHSLKVSPLPEQFWQLREMKNQDFPCGIDVFFASPEQICAIPRTTKVEA